MGTEFKHLFSPATIGTVELKNRIVMSAMGVNIKPTMVGRQLSDKYVTYLEARAAGGAGLVSAAWATTEEKAPFIADDYVGIWDDSFIPTLQMLTDKIHRHGAKIALHLIHGGSYAPSSKTGRQPVSASAMRNWLTGETTREATRDEISEIVVNFGKAVKRARRAGFDIVEFNIYSGYLIREFLSPLTNQRTDEYGGALENRIRILLEVIRASKAEAGADYTLMARISGDEFFPGGNRVAEGIEMACLLEAAGLDGLHVTPAGHQTPLPLNIGLTPKGVFLHLPRGIKQNVRIPVVATHLEDLFIAEKALADGTADLVAFGRSFLADPEFANKAKEGRLDDIRPCIRCVQGCFDRVFLEGDVTCFMNPALGKEKEFEVTPAVRKKKVMVIGGGPGGMQAALTAAERGHDVTLYEKSPSLGGQLNIAAVPPGKRDFAQAVVYFSNQLSKLSITVKLNTGVTADLVNAERPDAVVVATGAQPIVPNIPGLERKNVYSAFDVLEGRAEIGRRVVVIGGGGIGCETALYLAKMGAMEPETAIFLMQWKALDPAVALEMTKKGREVTIIEMLPKIAGDVGMARRGFLRNTLSMSGVTVISEAKATGITEDGVQIIDKDGGTRTVAGDTVVVAVGTRSANDLYRELEGKVPELHIVGDAKRAGKAMDAIHEAVRLGLGL